MLIVRTGPGRRSSRWSGSSVTAAAVAVGMYEQPPPRWRQAPDSAGSEAIVRVGGGRAEVALGAHAEPQQRRPGARRTRAPTRSMSAAGTPQISAQRSTG